jgi:hypothetical protein
MSLLFTQNKKAFIKFKGFCCSLYGLIYLPKILDPKIKTIINKIRKIKNNTLAIEAAPAAMPVKPNIAATMAMIKNIAAHLSI